MTMQCICQICNCGKHHCPCESEGAGEPPPDDTSDVIAPGDEEPLISEYQRRFQAHPDAVRTTRPNHDHQYKPPQGKMAHTTTFRHHQEEYKAPEGKMADVTISRSDYVQHPLIPRNPRPKSAYVPPEGEMRSGTTYTEDYQPHAAPAMQLHPQHSHHNTRGQHQQMQMPTAGKMDTLSTYKDEFRTWPLQRRQPYREVDNLCMTREAACRFTATTTFRDDYQPVTTNVARQPCKPAASCLNMYQGQGQAAPFTSTTNYRLQYVKHPLEVSKRPSSAPVRGTASSHLI
ncbi:stabilizer of axonemal microtubules 1-like [Engraulis encrasicolus]|uniref:stabilizer of axonemal microtubules 1-like n=1 Tax=Engraulis encrasicolus TaxID=184585 RepID=UPI002FCFD4F4